MSNKLVVTPLLVVLALALSGCASVAPPSQLNAVQSRHDTRLPGAADLPRGAPSSSAWWQALEDPQLEWLVRQMQARNLTVKAALASVQEARALAGLAHREGLPQGGLAVTAQASRPSLPEVDPYRQGQPRPPEQSLIGIGQTLSWEIDLFGRVGTAQAVAERELDGSTADLHAAQALLHAELVQRYVQLRAAQQLSELGQRNLILNDTRLDHLQIRVTAGLADARELRAAQVEQAQRRSEQEGLHAQVQQSLAAIALLCGRAPAALDIELATLRQTADLPRLPSQRSLQLSDNLLPRLPQVARADAALRASMGQQVLAERAHLPRLSLTATLGLNEGLSRLGRVGALRYAAGPALQWEWLDAGRRQAREDAARAGSERAWAQFEHSLLQALAEGESALRGWSAQYQGWQQTQLAETAAAEAARYSGERYKAGLEPRLSALTSESQWLQVRQRSVSQHAQALQAYVQVQLALGAWQPD